MMKFRKDEKKEPCMYVLKLIKIWKNEKKIKKILKK